MIAGCAFARLVALEMRAAKTTRAVVFMCGRSNGEPT